MGLCFGDKPEVVAQVIARSELCLNHSGMARVYVEYL